MIMVMRLPVTRSRRCEQMTALGASEVPDVKINAQIESMSGSSPGSPAVACTSSASASDEPNVDAGSSGAAKRPDDEDGWKAIGDRREQRLVAGFGDHEAAVRVLRVAEEVLVAPGVVEPDDRGPDQCRATEHEQVVGRVVEQDRDVTWPLGREALEEQGREPARLVEVLGVRPDLVVELDRDPVAEFLGVAAQERGRVRSDERGLARRRNRPRRET